MGPVGDFLDMHISPEIVHCLGWYYYPKLNTPLENRLPDSISHTQPAGMLE